MQIAATLLLAAGALSAFPARADEDEVAVPIAVREAHQTNALEIAVGAGAAEGLGTVVSQGPSVDTQGAGVDFSAGWRVNPRWMVGVYGAGALYASSGNSASNTYGASAGVQADYHFDAPARPWIGLGAGWHGYWLAQDHGTTAYQGVDLLRVQLGLEKAVAPWLSLEPVIGVTLSTLLSQKPPSASRWEDVKSNSVSVNLLLGVLARFDMFGQAADPAVLASNSTPDRR